MSDELNKQNVMKSSEVSPDDIEDLKLDRSRRRMAVATMATPIVASLMSRPVWATGCTGGGGCGVSGFLSGNLSNQEPKVCYRKGNSPGFWKNHPKAWSTGFYKSGRKKWVDGEKCWDFLSSSSGATMWSVVFPGISPRTSGVNGNPTLFEVLHMSRGALQRHAVAALLNAEYWPGYGTSASDIIDAMNYVFFPPASESRSRRELKCALKDVLDYYGDKDLGQGRAIKKYYDPVEQECVGNEIFD